MRVNQWLSVLSVVFTWLIKWEWLLLFPLASGVFRLLFHFHPVMRTVKWFLRKNCANIFKGDYA
ncbi:DUF4395 family protein [Anoxybacillus tepidamans]|uniref:DUF4395 family protein n=1 Tax=Anoxybacteroides tepidamans TaxID=265948 RepID=UPI0012EC8031